MPLLVGLDRVAGPIALVELGASAGLCLGVDRYAYRFDDGQVRGGRRSTADLHDDGCGRPPTALPDIAWRAGVDLAPLALDDPDDVDWLAALLPPDRPQRLDRLRAASARLRDDPPHIVTGDALEELPGLSPRHPRAPAPSSPALGTLVYLAPAARAEVARLCAEAGARLITFEPVSALPEVQQRLERIHRTRPDPVRARPRRRTARLRLRTRRSAVLAEPVRQPDAAAGSA